MIARLSFTLTLKISQHGLSDLVYSVPTPVTPPTTPVTPPATPVTTPDTPPVVYGQNEPEVDQPNVPPAVNILEENSPLADTSEEPPVDLPDENPPLSETPEASVKLEKSVETDKPSEPSKPGDQVIPDVPGEDTTDLPDEPVPEGDQPPEDR